MKPSEWDRGDIERWRRKSLIEAIIKKQKQNKPFDLSFSFYELQDTFDKLYELFPDGKWVTEPFAERMLIMSKLDDE